MTSGTVLNVIRYQINRWTKDYDNIAHDPGILGTVYNIIERQTHKNPGTNRFGDIVAEVYNRMATLLGIS